MATSMKDVAKLAGVSTATVSYVINNRPNVKEETRKSVQSAIEKLNYKINPIARNLRNGQSRQILFMVSNLKNYFYMGIASAIQNTIKPHGFILVFMDSDESPMLEEKNIREAVLENYAGFIIAPVTQDWNHLKEVLGDKPCVFIDRQPQYVERDCVLNDNYEGGYDLATNLIKKGKTRIAFCSGRFDTTMKERLNGYEAALTENHIAVDKNLQLFGIGKPQIYDTFTSWNSWDDALERFLTTAKPNAIVSGNSVFAFCAMHYFMRHHIMVPEEIAIATFDSPFWLALRGSDIIAKPQNVYKLGETAAKALLGRIRGDQSPFTTYRIEMLQSAIQA